MLALVIPSLQALIVVLIVLVICGVAWKFVEGYVAAPFKSIIIAVFAIGAALLLLHLFGVI